jgi:hypothetical protein
MNDPGGPPREARSQQESWAKARQLDQDYQKGDRRTDKSYQKADPSKGTGGTRW